MSSLPVTCWSVRIESPDDSEPYLGDVYVEEVVVNGPVNDLEIECWRKMSEWKSMPLNPVFRILSRYAG